MRRRLRSPPGRASRPVATWSSGLKSNLRQRRLAAAHFAGSPCRPRRPGRRDATGWESCVGSRSTSAASWSSSAWRWRLLLAQLAAFFLAGLALGRVLGLADRLGDLVRLAVQLLDLDSASFPPPGLQFDEVGRRRPSTPRLRQFCSTSSAFSTMNLRSSMVTGVLDEWSGCTCRWSFSDAALRSSAHPSHDVPTSPTPPTAGAGLDAAVEIGQARTSRWGCGCCRRPGPSPAAAYRLPAARERRSRWGSSRLRG